MKKKIFIVWGILFALVPIGLLTTAPAYGEWDSSYYKKLLGYVPQGMAKFKHLAHPLLPDYSLPGANDVLGYYLSALVGAILIFAVFFLIMKMFGKKSES